MREEKEERRGRLCGLRIILGSRFVLISKQRSVCATSLGRLTRVTRMTNFRRRNNNKEDMIAVRKNTGSLWYKKFYFYFYFSRSFCCSTHADNVQSSAALISADSDPHTETKTSLMVLIVHYYVSRRVIKDPSCRLDFPKDSTTFISLSFSAINVSRRSKKHIFVFPIFILFFLFIFYMSTFAQTWRV